MTLKQRYTQLVHDYCKEFYSQMYLDGEERYDPDYWTGKEVGGVLLVDRCSMYLDFKNIRTVVDYGIPWEVLCNWYYEDVDRGIEGKPFANLLNYWKMVRGEDDFEKAHVKVCEMFDEKKKKPNFSKEKLLEWAEKANEEQRKIIEE